MDVIINFFSNIQDKFINNFIVEDRWLWMIKGMGITIEVSVIASILGLAIGLLIAIAILSKNKFFKTIASGYVDIIRGTPSVIQLLIIYFVVFGSVRWPKAIVASFAFAINSGAYVSEIIRAGILSVDKGQMEAGRSLGLSEAQTMIKIIIPQAVKNIFPALCNEFIVLIKETAIVGYIGLQDLTMAANLIASRTYAAFMPLVGAALIYFLIIKLLTCLFKFIEAKLRKADLH